MVGQTAPQPTNAKRSFVPWGLRPGPSHALILLCIVAVVLAGDALLRSRSDFDYRLIRAIRGTDFPGAKPIAEFLYDIGDPLVLLIAWFVGLAVFGALRRWLEMAAWASFALAGAGAWALAAAIGRPRPGPEEVDTTIPAFEQFIDFTFPSATVIGSVVLLGFLGILAGGLEPRRRWPIRLSLLVLLLAMGWAPILLEEHWVGDVIAGYVIGLLALLGVATAYGSMTPFFGRLPLIRAAPVPHDEALPHAHALTSTLLFRDGHVIKVYNPGFVPRFIYWLSFQAPFAYSYNETALEAAVLRRNLAGLLCEYWFGRNLVAPAIGITQVDGRLALLSHYIEGEPPRDRADARAFLFSLAGRFDEAGLPTWQVDPRQPRSLGNILETGPGEYTVIDLESGMVSPMASPRAWWRAIRRARVPIYDDVYFDITGRYVERELEQMRSRMGEAWTNRLQTLLEAGEAAADRWHTGEVRLWSRLLRFVWSGFGIGPLRRWLVGRRDRGLELAMGWIEESIDRWEAEGRYTPEQAERTRLQLRDPALQDVLPHFGVHLLVGLALRFPFGSIVRASYTLVNLLMAFVALGLRRTDLRGFRRSLSIHSPLVLVVAALPGVGTFSYLLSGPMIANKQIWRVSIDTVGMKFPFRVYERLGFRRIIAGRTPTTRTSGA